MAIYRLSDSKPTTILISGDNERTTFTVASVLAHHNVPFFIVAEMVTGALVHYSTHIITNRDQLPAVPQIIFDCRWQPEDDSVLHFIFDIYRNTPIISASPCRTSTELQTFYGTDAPVIRCNALPGFFPGMKHLEVAPAIITPPEALHYVERYLHLLGFETEVIGDVIGFVAPRVLSMLINEAAFTLMEAVASVQDIDTAMKLGTNYPYGPLEWADLIGLDSVLDILDALYEEYGQERYRSCVLLRRYVDAGWTGMLEGRGFYHYNEQGEKILSLQ